MVSDYIYEEMEKRNADGVDFIPIFSGECPPIFASYTKEQWKEVKSYPKSGRRYWMLDNKGQKIYIK